MGKGCRASNLVCHPAVPARPARRRLPSGKSDESCQCLYMFHIRRASQLGKTRLKVQTPLPYLVHVSACSSAARAVEGRGAKHEKAGRLTSNSGLLREGASPHYSASFCSLATHPAVCLNSTVAMASDLLKHHHVLIRVSSGPVSPARAMLKSPPSPTHFPLPQPLLSHAVTASSPVSEMGATLRPAKEV